MARSLSATLGQRLMAGLWWGPLRRPFEALTRRLPLRRIVAGPLAGQPWNGGLAERLGIYELHVQQALAERLHSGATLYDVGGHRGYFAGLALVGVGEKGRVVVFEPLPDNAELIRKALGSSIAVHEVAVADEDGRASLHWQPLASTAIASLDPAEIKAGQEIEVQTIRLDSFWDADSGAPPDVIKVDVEGAEGRVLNGAERLLTEVRPRWLIEVHSEGQDAEVRALLEQNGYELIQLRSARNRAYPYHLVAEPPSR